MALLSQKVTPNNIGNTIAAKEVHSVAQRQENSSNILFSFVWPGIISIWSVSLGFQNRPEALKKTGNMQILNSQAGPDLSKLMSIWHMKTCKKIDLSVVYNEQIICFLIFNIFYY